MGPGAYLEMIGIETDDTNGNMFNNNFLGQDGKLSHQREGKVFQVMGAPEGDYELNAGETAKMTAQRGQDQTFKARNVASGGGGLMSNETSPDASPSPAKVQPEVRRLNDYERRIMNIAEFTDEQLDPVTILGISVTLSHCLRYISSVSFLKLLKLCISWIILHRIIIYSYILLRCGIKRFL